MDRVELIQEPVTLEELYDKSVEDLKTAEAKLAKAEEAFERESCQDIPLSQFSELEGRVRYLFGVAESHRKIVSGLESQLAQVRAEDNRVQEGLAKETRRRTLLEDLDRVALELNQLHAEFRSLPEKIHILEFQHSQILKELSI